MSKPKRAAGLHTGKPSVHTTQLPQSFASFMDVRQAVIEVARIGDHAERAGFRRARCGKWHCGIHEDRNPSCTIRGERIRCWVCGESWNAIDLEMVATGQPFIRAMQSLASEYGLSLKPDCGDTQTARQNAQERAQNRELAFNWRTGFLALADEVLEGEKTRLFDPGTGPADLALIRSLTRAEGIIRGAQSERRLVNAFDAFNRTMPGLTQQLTVFGERQRHEQQARLAAFIELMGKAEGAC